MGKLLFWAAVLAVVYLAFKVATAARRHRDATGNPGEHKDGGEPMVQCAHCGVHLPASEALRAGEHLYCCDAHRDLGA